MSKRALAILAVVEGIVILGLAGLLVGGAGLGAPWMRWDGLRSGFHPGMMGWWGGGPMGWGWMFARWLVGLIPIALVAVIVALLLRPRKPEEPKA